MGSTLSPAKVLLLAVHLAAHADIEGLGQLSSQHPAVLHTAVVLRILLTHLPETTRPAIYVGFLQELAAGQPAQRPGVELDVSPVRALSEQQAAKRAKKLRLLQLQSQEAPAQSHGDALGLFLFQRACRMDGETGMLSQLPDLLVPFLESLPSPAHLDFRDRPAICEAKLQSITPRPRLLTRLWNSKNCPIKTPSVHLLACTGLNQSDQGHIGRDLRAYGSVPWLYDDSRWVEALRSGQKPLVAMAIPHPKVVCPGWEQSAYTGSPPWPTRSWKLTVDAFEQWNGPADVYFGHEVNLTLSPPRQRYLDQSYARAALASAYAVQEASVDSLSGLYQMLTRLRSLLGHGQEDLPLQDALTALPSMSIADGPTFGSAKTAANMRNDLLRPQNPLTTANPAATSLLMTLVLSAFICTRLGAPLAVKKAGDLVFLQDEREQKSEIGRLLRAVQNNAPRDDDEYWVEARREILWLRGCCQEDSSPTCGAAEVSLRRYLSSRSKSIFLKHCFLRHVRF